MKTQVPVLAIIIIFLVNVTATAQTIIPGSIIRKKADTLFKHHETDPQVSVTEVNSVPRWNGSTLTNGTIYDNGYAVGIHTAIPQASLHVLGNDETLILEEATANSLGTGTMLLLRGHTTSQTNSEGRIGLVPDDMFYPYRNGAIEIRPQSRTNFYKSFNVTDPSNLAMTIVNSGIGMGTASPDASAALDISSGSQGVLIPRMSKDQRLSITHPANGLLVYQTGEKSGIYYYDDTAWKSTAGNCNSSKAGDDNISSLQEQVAKQQTEIDELKAMVVSLTSPATSSLSNKVAVSLSSASLSQNIPNPLHGTTIINYTLPAAYSSAKLILTDNGGKMLKDISLSGKGNGSLSINASALALGTYQYALVVDGKLIDKKQMSVLK